MPELPDPHVAVRSEAPAAFIRPEAVSKQFCSTDDRAELLRIRQERREAMTRLRRTGGRDWRDAP